MTDGCNPNHAALRPVCRKWGKPRQRSRYRHCADRRRSAPHPARRLKGCLRAAAEELAALGDETAAYTAELFGDKAGRQGCLWVGDAALPQEAAFTAWLKQNPAWADHSRVEQLYTDVRGQTRLQDGVADDGSLRFTRVLGQYDPLDKAKALVFEAPVRLENASHEAMCLLEHCCAATRHIGTHRNRGLGNVRLTYIPGTDTPTAPQKPPLPDADTVTLTYHVQLKTPLTLPGCGKQLTAIPARSIIGAWPERTCGRAQRRMMRFADCFWMERPAGAR